ncbi:MAG: ferredoxin--NADP reductase [Cyclobacteriaceae bacterium]|nr:ferredoxin--NADP reductase [Cyclobacteriaceae bacterium]
MADRELNSIVTHIMQVSPMMKIVRVKPDSWELPQFTAGQFISLGLPASALRIADSEPEEKEFKPGKMIRRLYSIASSSVLKEYIEFYITIVHSGALTPRIFNLQIGDRIELGKRTSGMFTLDEVPEGNNIILIATGTGVAPYISMIRSNALQKGIGKLAVIHGAANSWDLGYSSELTLIESMSDKFTYLPTILMPEKEPAGWHGDTRFIQDIWKDGAMEKTWGFKPTPDNTHIFLCGNPGMTEAMSEILGAEGFIEHSRKTPGQIHIESW